MTMFDDFRQQASGEEAFEPVEDQTVVNTGIRERLKSMRVPRPGSGPDYFLGMTAPQRTVIALMLLMSTCIMGFFFLLVTNKIAPF
jgi:hypothetical protein